MQRNEAFHHGAKSGHRMRLMTMHRQRAGFALERFAKHTTRPTGCRCVRPPGADDHRRQAHGTSVEMPLTHMIIEQQLTDRLGHTVGSARGVFGEIAHRRGHVLAAEARYAAGKHHTRLSGCGAGRLKNMPAAIKIHPQRIIVPLLAFTADHGGEMENGKTCSASDSLFNHRLLSYITFHPPRGGNSWAYAKACVQQHQFLDRFHVAGCSGQFPTRQQRLGQFRSQKSAAAGDDNFHAPFSSSSPLIASRCVSRPL